MVEYAPGMRTIIRNEEWMGELLRLIEVGVVHGIFAGGTDRYGRSCKDHGMHQAEHSGSGQTRQNQACEDAQE